MEDHTEWLVAELKKAAERIEYLERELSEERHSREMASQKAWEFADRIKELEQQLKSRRS